MKKLFGEDGKIKIGAQTYLKRFYESLVSVDVAKSNGGWNPFAEQDTQSFPIQTKYTK